MATSSPHFLYSAPFIIGFLFLPSSVLARRGGGSSGGSSILGGDDGAPIVLNDPIDIALLALGIVFGLVSIVQLVFVFRKRKAASAKNVPYGAPVASTAPKHSSASISTMMLALLVLVAYDAVTAAFGVLDNSPDLSLFRQLQSLYKAIFVLRPLETALLILANLLLLWNIHSRSDTRSSLFPIIAVAISLLLALMLTFYWIETFLLDASDTVVLALAGLYSAVYLLATILLLVASVVLKRSISKYVVRFAFVFLISATFIVLAILDTLFFWIPVDLGIYSRALLALVRLCLLGGASTIIVTSYLLV